MTDFQFSMLLGNLYILTAGIITSNKNNNLFVVLSLLLVGVTLIAFGLWK